MLHDAHGFWIAEAGSPAVLPPLEGEASADVVVIGGGYTGLWTAWHVLAAAPDARVVVLESGRCGHGPSGRNGGFVSSLDLSLPSLRADYGEAAATALAAARDDLFRGRPFLIVPTARSDSGAMTVAGAVARDGGPRPVTLQAAAMGMSSRFATAITALACARSSATSKTASIRASSSPTSATKSWAPAAGWSTATTSRAPRSAEHEPTRLEWTPEGAALGGWLVVPVALGLGAGWFSGLGKGGVGAAAWSGAAGIGAPPERRRANAFDLLLA